MATLPIRRWRGSGIWYSYLVWGGSGRSSWFTDGYGPLVSDWPGQPLPVPWLWEYCKCVQVFISVMLQGIQHSPQSFYLACWGASCQPKRQQHPDYQAKWNAIILHSRLEPNRFTPSYSKAICLPFVTVHPPVSSLCTATFSPIISDLHQEGGKEGEGGTILFEIKWHQALLLLFYGAAERIKTLQKLKKLGKVPQGRKWNKSNLSSGVPRCQVPCGSPASCICSGIRYARECDLSRRDIIKICWVLPEISFIVNSPPLPFKLLWAENEYSENECKWT